MITTYTKQQMLERWRLVRHLEPLRADVAVTFDGVDTAALDEAEMMAWWAFTVDTAPLH